MMTQRRKSACESGNCVAGCRTVFASAEQLRLHIDIAMMHHLLLQYSRHKETYVRDFYQFLLPNDFITIPFWWSTRLVRERFADIELQNESSDPTDRTHVLLDLNCITSFSLSLTRMKGTSLWLCVAWINIRILQNQVSHAQLDEVCRLVRSENCFHSVIVEINIPSGVWKSRSAPMREEVGAGTVGRNSRRTSNLRGVSEAE